MRPKWKDRYFELENEIIKSIERPRYKDIGCNEILNRKLNQLVKLSNIIRRNEDWKELKHINGADKE